MEGSGSMVGLIIGGLSGIIVVFSIIKALEQRDFDVILKYSRHKNLFSSDYYEINPYINKQGLE